MFAAHNRVTDARRALCKCIMLLATDGLIGLLLAAILAYPLTLGTMRFVYDALDRQLADKIVRDARERPARRLQSPGEKHVFVERRAGVPFLIHQPLAGNSLEPAWFKDRNFKATLITRYQVFKTPADRNVYEARIHERDADPAKLDSPHYRHPAGPLYGLDAILIEIVLVELPTGERHLVLDCGIQTAPDEYRRLPWFSSEGASDSNALLSVTRNDWVADVRQVNCPTTADSFSTWLNHDFLPVAKGVNPHYAVIGALKLSPKEFSRQVVHPLEELIAQDVGGLAIRPDVLRLSLIGGILQWLMMHTLYMVFLAAGARALLHLVIERQYFRKLRDAAAADDGGRRLRRSVRKFHGRHRDQFADRSLVLESAADGDVGRSNDVALVRATVKDIEDRRAKGNRTIAEHSAQMNYWGMLGSLVFIAVSLSALRLHPNPAVTGATLSTMAASLGQAFWTTAVSSTLCRVVMWLGVIQGGAEDKLSDQWMDWVANLPAPRPSASLPHPSASHSLPGQTLPVSTPSLSP